MITGKQARVMVTVASGITVAAAAPPPQGLSVGSYPAVAKVDQRFQSYNIEMTEVIGGTFWAPYNEDGTTPAKKQNKRDAIDLKNDVRIRKLARALGPAYVRVSGTWANSTWFQDDDLPPRTTPPSGYQGVLTRAQWSGLVSFAKAVDAKIVTSFPISAGARNPDGSWNPDSARRLLRYNRRIGGPLVAVQPINEANLGVGSGLPRQYSPADFARDHVAFKSLIDSEAPGVLFVGPTAAGDIGDYLEKRKGAFLSYTTDFLMSGEPRPKFDVFAYHFYTSSSQRCRGKDAAKPEVALNEDWFDEANRYTNYYGPMRDRYAPGKPIWVTEIGQASCGGDPWAKSFIDTFRYVDNMARLAKGGVSAIFHNTLAASDYALIDDQTWQPRPSYWAAVLWRRLMGQVVLDAGPVKPGTHVYAHCLRGVPGGVALLALNLNRNSTAKLQLPMRAQRYTLSADDLLGTRAKLNGKPLALVGDDLPPLKPVSTVKGSVQLPPLTVSFFGVPDAANPACR